MIKITTDEKLRGPIWGSVIDSLVGEYFETNWDVYALAISIGMISDEQIENEDMVPEDYDEEPRNIPRTMMSKPQNASLMELMLQSALVTTKHLDLDEETRLKYAFDDKANLDFKPIPFLTKYANYGVTKIHETISEHDDTETMFQLATLLNMTYENGHNDIYTNEDIIEENQDV